MLKNLFIPGAEYENIYNDNKEYYNPEIPQHQLPPPSELSAPSLSSYLPFSSLSNEGNKEIATKVLLAPLIGVALLGVVAALINNPVLLQIGVLSSKGKKRRRRKINQNDIPLNFLKFQENLILLRQLISQVMVIPRNF